MHSRTARSIRTAVLAVVAAGALTLGGAGAAMAATGNSIEGVRDLVITPDAPSVNFSTPGTTGTVSWGIDDGTEQVNFNNHTVYEGDTSSRTWTVPVGLEFVYTPGACPNSGYPASEPPAFTVECSVSADGRTFTEEFTATRTQSWTGGFTDQRRSSLTVVSTGEPITGAPTATFEPWTGLTTNSPETTGVIVNDEAPGTPLLAGGAIALVALAGAGTVYGMRRRRNG